jgi:hypothetical protein
MIELLDIHFQYIKEGKPDGPEDDPLYDEMYLVYHNLTKEEQVNIGKYAYSIYPDTSLLITEVN